jgi:hypothetical protein
MTDSERGGQASASEPESSDDQQLRHLKITYEVDGKVIRVVEKQVTKKYCWYLMGNSSWREW